MHATALVGREQERAIVEDALNLVATGSGAALLIAGEAGIGKTRLAEEAVEMARRRRFARPDAHQ
jgi:predicted ATPase